MNNIIYSIIVPLYNEAAVLSATYTRIKEVMDSTKENYEIIFVNDGSEDNTRNIAEAICKIDIKIKLLNFSRNFGHQAAITAGMAHSKGSAVVVIDADLQDPPEVILEMIKKWKEGYQVVYGKRAKRENETFFKAFTAGIYYRFLSCMASIDIPVDTGDFRLVDRIVCDILTALPEKNRYIRGLVSWVGFKQTSVEYIRKGRFAGESKYPLRKMIKLALDGITSFSTKPLMFPCYLGTILFFIGMISSTVIAVNNLFLGNPAVNLNLILSITILLFGLLFCSIGIMGQYLGRVFDESKDRPLYILNESTNYNTKEKNKELSI
nr:glycosyltransferase family 2 protein [Clostridium oryzae]